MRRKWRQHGRRTRQKREVRGAAPMSSVWRFEATEAALPKRRAYPCHCSGFGAMLVSAGKLLDLMIIALTRNLTLPVKYR